MDPQGRGFVLAREERGESDLGVTLLLEDGSLVRAVARGAARSTRRFTSGLAPFTLYRFAFGRTSLASAQLNEAYAECVYPAILTDLRRLGAAAAAAVLVRDLGGEVAHDSACFDLYAELITTLERADAAAAGGALVRFAFEMFAQSGHPVVLDGCARCGREAPANAMVRLDPAAGGVVCVACGGGPVALRAAERRELRAVAEGDARAFRPTMLHVLARLVEPHARRGSETIERAIAYWATT